LPFCPSRIGIRGKSGRLLGDGLTLAAPDDTLEIPPKARLPADPAVTMRVMDSSALRPGNGHFVEKPVRILLRGSDSP